MEKLLHSFGKDIEMSHGINKDKLKIDLQRLGTQSVKSSSRRIS